MHSEVMRKAHHLPSISQVTQMVISISVNFLEVLKPQALQQRLQRYGISRKETDDLNALDVDVL